MIARSDGQAQRSESWHLSADEKLKILEEAPQPETTVAEALRWHPLEEKTFYR